MHCLLVGLLLNIYLPRIQQLLVTVDLSFNLSILNLLGQVVHHLQRDAKSCRNLSHVDNFIGRNILLQVFVANQAVNALGSKEEIVFKLLLN
jgi:hypothetical protein